MGYGAPRVIFKGAVKPMQAVAPQQEAPAPVVKPEVTEPIEETTPETVVDEEVLIPTTFVKKTEETDVNQYVRRRK